MALALALTAVPTAQASAQQHPPAPEPATFVTAQDGAIVVTSSATGDVVRRLTTPEPAGADSEPFLADDGQSVVFVRMVSYCLSGIYMVPTRGGAARVVVPPEAGFVTAPQLSVDGRRLAYHRVDCTAGAPTLSVREMGSGATHTIAMPNTGYSIDYTFTADGRRIVVLLITGVTPPPQAWSIPVGAISYAEGRRLAVDVPGCYLRFVTRIGASGDLAFDETCRRQFPEHVVRADAVTGRRGATLASVPETEVGFAGIDFDAAGRHFLIQGQSGAVYTVRNGAIVQLGTQTVNGMLASTW